MGSEEGILPIRYYGTSLEVEIFENPEDGISNIDLLLSSAIESIEGGRIVSGVCTKLLRGDVNYSLLLESLLKKILDLLESDIGNITARSEALDAHGEPYLLCLALGERSAGLLIPADFLPSKHSQPAGSKNMDGIFSHAITTDRVVLSNDVRNDPRSTKKIPKNHPSIERFLAIPLRYHNSIIGLLSVANRPEPYTLDSVRKVLPLLNICSHLLVRVCDSQETLASKIQRTSTADEAKDRFLATMSHELRTPLNGIMGMVSLLPEAGPLNDKQILYVRNLTECAVELTSLLNNILDFSKMASDRLLLQKQPLEIQSVIDDAVKIVEGNAMAKGIKLQIPCVDIPTMIGDRQRLVQILSNLLGNAVKFTEQGSVVISVDTKVIDGKDESVDYETKKRKILFKVRDTGIGIPQEEQDLIFEVFHQSSSLSAYLSKSGTGLGLSIARELVRLMGGTISVSSQGIPGKGSEFSFYIILDEELDISKLSGEHTEVLQGSRILVVDDRPEMRLQLSDILFKWKCIPQAVSSAEEALQYLQYGMEFSVALIDICMPNMSGVELAQDLRRKYPGLPLIGISSVELHTGEEYFDHYMYKPIDQNTLFPALLSCLTQPRNKIVSASREKKSRRHLKILVAEDDRHNVFTLTELLVSLGYRKKNITITSDGKECVEKAKLETPDVVLMDIIMPKMDGLQASKIIKRLPNSPMIIAVSAAVQPSDKARCQGAGIDGYLAKPILREKLDAALSPLVRPQRKIKSKTSRSSKRHEH